MKTPCEQLGYKVGDKFEVLRDNTAFEKGQIVELYMDDETNTPLFKGDNKFGFELCDGEPGAYLTLIKEVKPLKAETQQTENVDPLLSNLTDEELCSRYQFDDNPVIQEFVKRLEASEALVSNLEAQLEDIEQYE